MRPTRVVIDLSVIRHNIECIRALTGRKIMMAIKADAYGHGAHAVGRYVEEMSLVDMLGVTSIEEGIDLREAGVTLPILIFSIINTSKEDIDSVFEYDLMPTVADTSLVAPLAEGAKRFGRKIDVHIKTDTGMGRLGLKPAETLEVMEEIEKVPEITIAGMYTHFPVSDVPGNEFTVRQIESFNTLADNARKKGIDTGIRHCANSGAVILYPGSHMDMVRPGILCYGIYPSGDCPRIIDVKPAMTMKSAIMFVKRVKKGTGLSYGLTYKAAKDTYIATIPVGYADGYTRALSNRASVLIDDKPYPVVGRICMDQCLVDLGDDLYAPGQEVVLFGDHGITASDIAAWSDTIPYEVTCHMSRRVPRTYTKNSD